MESSKEDETRLDVKHLITTFSDKEISRTSAGSKEKGKRLKAPRSVTSECLSLKSDQSIDPPLLFKDENEKKPGSIYSKSASHQSRDEPGDFRKKQSARPDIDYPDYATVTSSNSSTLHSDDKIKVPYGVPRAWGGHVMCPRDPQRWRVQPQLAVYPVVRADYRAPDDFIPSRVKGSSAKSSAESQRDNHWMYFPSRNHSWDHPLSYQGSSEIDKETVRSYDIQEEVMCDICHEATAVKTCLTCNMSYCEYHGRPHYKVEALQRHKVIDVSSEVEEILCQHYTRPLDFFCRTDKMQICSICAQGNHRGHDIISQKPGGYVNQVPGPPKTVVPPPGNIKFLSVKPNSVVLSWEGPKGLEGTKRFRLEWSSATKVGGCVVDCHKLEVNNLQLGQKYNFSVATEGKDGNLSEWITASVFTALPSPQHLTKGHSEATALSVKWTKGENMEGIPHQFLIKVTSPGKELLAMHTEDCYKTLSDLEPDTVYTISVLTVLNDQWSDPVSITLRTEPCLREVLSNIGLLEQYDNKLTLSAVLEINQSDVPQTNKLETGNVPPEAFLKNLITLNLHAINVGCLSPNVNADKSKAINPLDLTTAVFLCSDEFLRQNTVLKMNICQFAVPLLLPNYETREITLMLWSMREIVKTFRPTKQAFLKQNCTERIVLSDFPLVSFVRLRRTMWSKSQILNKLLSNSKPCHDTFYHRHMVCGDVDRRISDGLVEISWYLPCGERHKDEFTEPLAVANLRGDITTFDRQFSFLCQISAALYIFCDESEVDYFKNLEGKDVRANIILISSAQGKATLKMLKMKPSLKITNESQKKKTDTELVKSLQESISKMLENSPNKVSVANLAEKARLCGILVDEDSDECQSASKNAGKIAKQVANSSDFKDNQLASQGNVWKALSWLEIEHWRLRKAGNQNTEEYRKSLSARGKELRRKQVRFEATTAMSTFLHGVVTSEVQRYYFLKWLEIGLEDLSRKQLSALQDQYKELNQKFPRNTEKIAEIDKQICAGSLRLDHFFRECGQLYECATYLPEHSRQRKTMEQLPALCAQMLLDGFPLELVDGDASNIPMKWITEVLTELHYIMQSNSELKVITIIGAENSGKSTLLNTMFGVRFATGKGTCTKGAFIQLINVNKDIREELGCDCIMIIDTEGLKPYQMVQDDDSHERDKEVASLAVALSDVTMVSVSGDNSCMEDIFEMVLQAFTRLKGKGQKPLCHFVDTYESEVSAGVRRNSQELVECLNKMIRKDTRMKKANITELSDVMEFDPDTCSWQMPPFWHGTPPMAPFSPHYSEKAHALKKRLIGDLKKCKKETTDLMRFISRVESLWKSL